jgi:prepilin-type N-terminal cleavage/methylation domain-containing protein
MQTQQVRPAAARSRTENGFSLIELLVTLGITTVILGATMAALGDAVKATDAATLITGLNDSLRNGMDLMVRDLLQAGQGLPSGRVIQSPSGTGSVPIRLPGPRGTAYTFDGTSYCPPPTADCAQVAAIIPGPGLGPIVDGQQTDMITMLEADSAFDQVRLTSFATDGSSIRIESGVNITDGGPDDVMPGDLLMLSKGSTSALMQVTAVSGQQVTFGGSDSLLLNQSAAADGTILDLRAAAPTETPSPVYLPTTATRIRMISYYIDVVTDPQHPRLVRRINNGNAVTFDNTLGTAVSFDIDNLQITYDLADGSVNPANVRMTDADLQGTGACAPAACSPNQIRKANLMLSGRSRIPMRGTRQFFRNRLFTQVSLRSLAFVDRYR